MKKNRGDENWRGEARCKVGGVGVFRQVVFGCESVDFGGGEELRKGQERKNGRGEEGRKTWGEQKMVGREKVEGAEKSEGPKSNG